MLLYLLCVAGFWSCWNTTSGLTAHCSGRKVRMALHEWVKHDDEECWRKWNAVWVLTTTLENELHLQCNIIRRVEGDHTLPSPEPLNITRMVELLRRGKMTVFLPPGRNYKFINNFLLREQPLASHQFWFKAPLEEMVLKKILLTDFAKKTHFQKFHGKNQNLNLVGLELHYVVLWLLGCWDDEAGESEGLESDNDYVFFPLFHGL